MVATEFVQSCEILRHERDYTIGFQPRRGDRSTYGAISAPRRQSLPYHLISHANLISIAGQFLESKGGSTTRRKLVLKIWGLSLCTKCTLWLELCSFFNLFSNWTNKTAHVIMLYSSSGVSVLDLVMRFLDHFILQLCVLCCCLSSVYICVDRSGQSICFEYCPKAYSFPSAPVLCFLSILLRFYSFLFLQRE